MTRLLRTLARTVSRAAPASVPCVVVVGDVEVRTRGTWLREQRLVSQPKWPGGERLARSQDSIDSETIAVVSQISVPAADFEAAPQHGDPVSIEGRNMFCGVVLDMGPTYRIGLAAGRW